MVTSSPSVRSVMVMYTEASVGPYRFTRRPPPCSLNLETRAGETCSPPTMVNCRSLDALQKLSFVRAHGETGGRKLDEAGLVLLDEFRQLPGKQHLLLIRQDNGLSKGKRQQASVIKMSNTGVVAQITGRVTHSSASFIFARRLEMDR